MCCLLALTLAGAFLLPYASGETGQLSHILRLGSEGEELGEEEASEEPVEVTFTLRLVGEALPGGEEEFFGEYGLEAEAGEVLTQAQLLALIENMPDTTGFTLADGADFTVPETDGEAVTINYTRNEYALIFYGHSNTVFSETLVPFGGAVQAPDGKPPRTGYHFVEWTGFPEEPTVMGAAPQSYSARFAPDTETPYTVRLIGSALPGGEDEILASKALTGTSDSTVTMAGALDEFDTISFTGFTQGTAADFTIKADGTGVYDIPYARNSYMLTLTEYDGETMLDVLYNRPLSQVLPADTATKPYGKVFDCWQSHPANMPATPLTLEAVYKNGTFEVEFRNYNGDLLLGEAVSVDFGAIVPNASADAAEAEADASRPGYRFTHWATAPYGGTGSCGDDAENSHAIDFDGQGPVLETEGIIYHAHFAPDTETPYKIVFIGEKLDPAEGFDKGNPLRVRYEGEEDELTFITRYGTSDTPAEYSVSWLNGIAAIPGYRYEGVETAAQNIAPDGGTVFYVLFTRLSYDLRLVQEGDSTKGQAHPFRFGTPLEGLDFITAFENLANTEALLADGSNAMQYVYGHEFDCWMLSVTEGEEEDFASSGITELPAGGLTLYARYKAKQWNATFNYTSRLAYYPSEVESKTAVIPVYFGETITPPEVRRYGYSLKGWVDNATGVLYQPDELTMDKEGRGFTAKWEANEYTATFNYVDNAGNKTAYVYDVVFDTTFDVPVKDNNWNDNDSNSLTAWNQETGRLWKGHLLESWEWFDGRDVPQKHTLELNEQDGLDALPAMELEGGMSFTAKQPLNKYPVFFDWIDGSKTIMVEYGQSIDEAIAAQGFVWYQTESIADKYASDINPDDYKDVAPENLAKRKGHSIDYWTEYRKDGPLPDKFSTEKQFGNMPDCRRKFEDASHALTYWVAFEQYNEDRDRWDRIGAPIDVEFGKEIVLPNEPSPREYFTGWCVSTDTKLEDPISRKGADFIEKLTEEGMTLRARFDCPIEYKIDGRTERTDYVTLLSDIKKWAPAPPRGYHYTLWTSRPAADINLTKMPPRALTFECLTEINAFTIQFEYEDRNGNIKREPATPKPYVYNQTILLPEGVPASPETDNKKFTQWSYNGQKVNPGTDRADYPHSAEVLIKAQYRAPLIKSIEAKLPLGTTFSQGTLIDLSAKGLTFFVEYDNGFKDQRTDILALLSSKKVTYTPQTFAQAGSFDITVTYKDGTESATCKLRVQITPRFVSDVSMAKLPTKTTYYVGEKLDLRGGMLRIEYDNGTVTNNTPLTVNSASEYVDVSNFNSSAVGKRMLKVRYTAGGTTWETEFQVSIIAKPKGYLKGDVNNDGKINSLDLLLVKRHILGIETLKGEAFNAADINGDGKVNSLDAMKILRHILGQEKLK